MAIADRGTAKYRKMSDLDHDGFVVEAGVVTYEVGSPDAYVHYHFGRGQFEVVWHLDELDEHIKALQKVRKEMRK